MPAVSDKDSKMDRTRDMTAGSPARHILSFALPLIITNIGQQLYYIADASIVGRGLGVKALAAVGSTDWVTWLILWSMIGLCQGFSTFVSRAFGEKDYAAMNRAIAVAARLCLLIGLVLTVAGMLTAKAVLKLLETPEELLSDAWIYLMIITAGTPVVAAYNMSAAILRAVGDSKTPLVAMVIAAALNIGLDTLFIFAFDRGVEGAAVASVLAQCVAFGYCFVQLGKTRSVAFDRDAFFRSGRLGRNMLVFGIPIACQYIIIGLSGIIVQSGVNVQGSAFIAGYTAPNKLYGLMECSAISLGLASSTFLAQNYGAGEKLRVKQGVRVSAAIALLASLAVALFVLLLRQPLILLFLDASEAGTAEAMRVAIYYLSIMAISLPVLYMIQVYRNTLQAMEISVWSMVSGIAECVLRAAMAKLAIYYIGTDALFLAEPVAWAGGMLSVILPYYLWYKRKKLE